MTTIEVTDTDTDSDTRRDTGRAGARRDALAERLVTATTHALELFSVHLGRELGLYQALDDGPLTAPELARAASIAPRYATEWLEQQAVAGLIETEDGIQFSLPAPHRPVLLDGDDPAQTGPLADMVAGVAAVLRELPQAYRTGGGVPYAGYGDAFRRGQAGVNRPMFVHELPGWLRDLGLDDLLHAQAAPRIADVGCGEGWSTLALARTFPYAAVDGYDTDPASVEAARRRVAQAGLSDRVTVQVADGASLSGPYDLVLVFEALHDFARPVEVLAALRRSIASGGALLVGDERVAAAFAAPGDDVERLMYGWSVTHCLPASLADAPSAGLGTVLRSSTVVRLAADAGFRDCRVLPAGNDFFRLYRLDT